jgi:asparagine synthase (glutamine-hydrolysing)
VDEFAFYQLREKRLLRENDVVINGQSGDFISGGHMSGHHLPMLGESEEREVSLIVSGILKKHFSNYHHLAETDRDRLVERMESILELPPGQFGREVLAKAYERWEWQERQCKFVINGQRSYDWLGLSWMLPLWDDEYMHFWPRVPYRLKVGQGLYKKYLSRYNPGGLFNGVEPSMYNWQGWSMAALPFGKMVRILLGQAAREKFYQGFNYFGRYANHYAPFGFYSHLKTLSHYAKPMGRYAELWLEENMKNDGNY